jgi:hypothetical protein
MSSRPTTRKTNSCSCITYTAYIIDRVMDVVLVCEEHPPLADDWRPLHNEAHPAEHFEYCKRQVSLKHGPARGYHSGFGRGIFVGKYLHPSDVHIVLVHEMTHHLLFLADFSDDTQESFCLLASQIYAMHIPAILEYWNTALGRSGDQGS